MRQGALTDASRRGSGIRFVVTVVLSAGAGGGIVAYSDDWIEGLPMGPPVSAMPEFAGELDAAAHWFGETDQSLLLDSYSWSLAVSRERDVLRSIESQLPFLDHLMVGVLDPAIDEGEGLGLIAEIDIGAAADMDLLLDTSRVLEPVTIMAGTEYEHTMPVAVRLVTYHLDGPGITSPQAASTALWAEMSSANSQTTVEGWIIARHTVGPFLGTGQAALDYDDGSNGAMTADFGSCIDACLGSTNAPPAGLNQVAAVQSPANGQRLDVKGQNLPIKGIDVNIGLVRYSKAPIRVTYDWAGAAAGDSGTLVVDAHSGEPVAMHQGTADVYDNSGQPVIDPATGSTVRYAFGLCLYQLEAMKSLTFFM